MNPPHIITCSISTLLRMYTWALFISIDNTCTHEFTCVRMFYHGRQMQIPTSSGRNLGFAMNNMLLMIW